MNVRLFMCVKMSSAVSKYCFRWAKARRDAFWDTRRVGRFAALFEYLTRSVQSKQCCNIAASYN